MATRMEQDLIKAKVRRTIAERRMARPGETVLVACSGGADSVALLHLLRALAEEIGFSLAVAHFHHGLRPNADLDAAFVRDLAKRSGLPFVFGRRDVRAYAARRRLNLEEAGRILRYEFLKKAAVRTGAVRIATGHTLDDQAETVLIRLFRGSGPRGLAGIAPAGEEGIIRPLLGVRRREIEAYLRREKNSFRTDETNRDRRFLRNRIRHKLIPFLEKNFEPAIVPKLGLLAEILREEDDYLEAVARKDGARLISKGGPRPRLNAALLARFHPALARRVVRIFIVALRGDLRRISFEDVERLRRLREGQAAVLPGGLVLIRDGGWIFQRAEGSKKSRPAAEFSRRWDGRGTLLLPETGGRFSGRIIQMAKSKNPAFDDSRRCSSDADRLKFPLLVRNRRDGDRYRPFGAPGRKKLKELFREQGVPISERGRRAVFVSDDAIVWVEGLPVAEAFKVGPETRRIFLIEKKGYKSAARFRRRAGPRAGG